MNFSLEQYENLNPRCELVIDGKKIVFYTPSVFTKWRVDSIFQKEPWTIEWLNELKPNDVLLDVGANIGIYSIWAGVQRKCKVIALEPESMNYAILNRNILQNNLHQNVVAYCVGLSNTNDFCELNMQDLRVGGSNHAAGEALNYKLEEMQVNFKQGCVVFRLDDLIEQKKLPVPTHIKIDVDGFEHKIIEGAVCTLQNKNLKSLLIETNPNLNAHQKMIHELENLGFKFSDEQVNRAMRKEGPFKGVAEYVFRR